MDLGLLFGLKEVDGVSPTSLRFNLTQVSVSSLAPVNANLFEGPGNLFDGTSASPPNAGSFFRNALWSLRPDLARQGGLPGDR